MYITILLACIVSIFRKISYSEYSSGFIPTLKFFSSQRTMLFPRVSFDPEVLGPQKNSFLCPVGKLLLCLSMSQWLMGRSSSHVTPRAMPVGFLSQESVCPAPSPTPLLCRPICQFYPISLGGLCFVKATRISIPSLGDSDLEMGRFLFGKGRCPYHLSDNSKAHFHMSKVPSMWIPQSLSQAVWVQRFISGRAKVILNLHLGLCG